MIQYVQNTEARILEINF